MTGSTLVLCGMADASVCLLQFNEPARTLSLLLDMPAFHCRYMCRRV